MTKDRSRGRYPRAGRYLKGNVEENLSLGTLASGALISDTWDETVNETTRISSILVDWSVDEITFPHGPLLFGVAHSDYTDAEIEAVIENAGSWDSGNLISQEVAKRKIRIIGSMTSDIGDPAGGGTMDIRFNDGRPVRTKLNWILNSGDTLKMWVYNRSAAALATTVPVLKASGHANLWQTG